MRFADIACGSGSFLIGVYDLLLRHRTSYYNRNKRTRAEGIRAGCLTRDDNTLGLSLLQKSEILTNNIYGVDIDGQAVEVAQFSLYLKLLEDETPGSTRAHQQSLGGALLPSLIKNIISGNALIGTDFESGKLFTIEEDRKYNVMDFESTFPQIMKDGGFDAIVGNPPYSYMIDDAQQNYFAQHYKHQNYQRDLYMLFLEKYETALKLGGMLGVIVSNTWMQSVTTRKIRQYLVRRYKWHKILYLPDKVFNATVDTHVLAFELNNGDTEGLDEFTVDIRRGGKIEALHTLPKSIIAADGASINIVTPHEAQLLFRKINNRTVRAAEVCSVFNGIKPFEKGKGNPPQSEEVMREKPYVAEGVSKPAEDWSPLLRGSLIKRYTNLWNEDSWVLYGAWLAAPRDPAIFSAPLKIMVRQTGDSIIATLIQAGFVARNNMHILLPRLADYDLHYLLGVINSKLLNFAYHVMNPERGEALAEVKKEHVEQLPIRTINFSDAADKVRHDQMVGLVEGMLAAKAQQANARTDADINRLAHRVADLDHRIDELVYELYELTTEEIAIVEESK